MNNLEIEKASRKLLGEIWSSRTSIWPDKNLDPINILDPALAAECLGINYELSEDLGIFGDCGNRFEVAGSLDRDIKKILISRRFNLAIRRFTGAHEIGHWLLHSGKIKHRDKPIGGLDNRITKRPFEEREADYFAACFLMPRKLIKEHFENTFLTKAPLVFDDTTAFWLCPSDPDSLLRANIDSLDRALSIASAESFGGRHINSLANQFRVSATSMAIRIQELGLIKE
ncbi:MAG: ImmA/IrrE family metallo-endopeptidase [Proteobacteria bacterium]|nr:ImmA/IrrE family metallo-endopeptidase [Pseudomonadota bacterium]